MARQRVALVGDSTTSGGKIITGNDSVMSEGMATALLGDKVFCPQCGKTGTIIEGCENFFVHGKPVAYNGSQIACGCPAGTHRIIANKSFIFVDAPTADPSASFTNTITQSRTSGSASGFSSTSHNNSNNAFLLSQLSGSASKQNDIRIDAKALIQCAEEVCEKHLYYPEIKQAFIDDITTFSQKIVTQVESGQKSYEQGRDELIAEEKDILDQSFDWIINGLSVFGGIGLTMAGLALCTTGAGCVIGAFLVGHGVNGIEEGIRGFIAGDSNQSGFLKDAYKTSARNLGFDESVGELAYNLADLGLSVHGKLQLIPKLNEYGNPLRKLFYYGRKDLEMAYKQMNEILLSAEILGDVIALSDIVQKTNNLFILDKDIGQTSMVISSPKNVTNIEKIVEQCELYIKITGQKDEETSYYLCTNTYGEQYKK